MGSPTSKEKPESTESLVFDHYAIRLFIGVVALCLPWAVSIRASQIPDSISWAYHTVARDIFVGPLFVMGAFLICYKGHQATPDRLKKITGFWKYVGGIFGGCAGNVSRWGRKNEEDIVGWVGGIAAWGVALFPTSRCTQNCPRDVISTIHYISAFFLFAATVYFCLFAFRNRAQEKTGEFPEAKLRVCCYWFCGLGITVILLGMIFVKWTRYGATIKNLTFVAETAALGLFGLAWLVASQYIPVFTNETQRRKTGLEWLIRAILKL